LVQTLYQLLLQSYQQVQSESLFLKLISEQLSSIISGINIISAFIPKELENKTAKTLIAKIKEIVEK